MKRFRYRPLKTSYKQKKIHSTLKSLSSKGYALTVTDISRKTKVKYATVHDNLKVLERRKLIKPIRINTIRGKSKRKYWVASKRRY